MVKDRAPWYAAIRGVAELDTTEPLNNKSQPWGTLPLPLFCRHLSSPHLRPAPLGDTHTGTAGLGQVWFISKPLYFRMSKLICTGERTREPAHTAQRGEHTLRSHHGQEGPLPHLPWGLLFLCREPCPGLPGSRGHKGVSGARELASS